jgi:hypothetical protein
MKRVRVVATEPHNQIGMLMAYFVSLLGIEHFLKEVALVRTAVIQ